MSLGERQQLSSEHPDQADFYQAPDQNEQADEEKNGFPFHVRQIGQFVAVTLAIRPTNQHERAGSQQRDCRRLQMKHSVKAKREVDGPKEPHASAQEERILNGITRL